METPLSDHEVAEQLLRHARTLYQKLTEALSLALDRLEVGEEDPLPDAKSRAETIRAHRKALQTVLDIQAQLVRDAEKAESVRSINVEAARREIYRRLDRLMAEGEAG